MIFSPLFISVPLFQAFLFFAFLAFLRNSRYRLRHMILPVNIAVSSGYLLALMTFQMIFIEETLILSKFTDAFLGNWLLLNEVRMSIRNTVCSMSIH